jgi:hypothetical protein
MSPEEYLEQAERYKALKEAATNPVTRQHLESIECSFRTLAEAERRLSQSLKTEETLQRRHDPKAP